MVNLWPLLAVLALLAACGTTAPASIGDAPAGDPTLAEVRRAPETYLSAAVRWGGVIVAVRNLKDETRIEVVSRRLDRNGQPLAEDHSDGRFLARLAEFIDPVVYTAGREVTLRGTVEGTTEQTIGEFQYRYPVMHAQSIHLWEQRPAPARYRDYDPFWHDPFYPLGYPYSPFYRPRWLY